MCSNRKRNGGGILNDQFAGVKRALCFAAHYDDEALFFGGTLLELARQGTEIHIAVLTDVAYCNAPRNNEERSREDARQRMRLGAFARVCADLNARSHHGRLPQIAESDNPKRIKMQAYQFLETLCDDLRLDLILTHGSDGDYSAPRYLKGYDTARAQHALCHEMAATIGKGYTTVWERHLGGNIIIPARPSDRLALLDYYRFGCTQAPEWPAEKWYPEFALAEEERYICL